MKKPTSIAICRHNCMSTVRRILIIGILVFGACTPSNPPPSPEVQFVSRPAVESPKAILPNGTTLTLELALTPEEIQTGLMFRPSFPPDRGMLFVFKQERTPSFWMKNTMIPLDLVFLDGKGTVVDAIADVQPCGADPCPQYPPKRPAYAVLEIAAGNASRLGIAEGIQIIFERVPGFPIVDYSSSESEDAELEEEAEEAKETIP